MKTTKRGDLYYTTVKSHKTGVVYVGFGIQPAIARKCCYAAIRKDAA